MKKEYDFSKGEKNPYAKMFKKQITIRMDENIVTYFKGLSTNQECSTIRITSSVIYVYTNIQESDYRRLLQ
jgi:hypothetical protein